MSQGTSNAVATAAIITSAAAAPANVMARGNFMRLMPVAIYCSIVFSNHGGCFSATMVALYRRTIVARESSFDLKLSGPRIALIKLMISEMPTQYVANFCGRTLETARGFFQQPAGVTKRIRKKRSTHVAA
jgi:hypothetical protein